MTEENKVNEDRVKIGEADPRQSKSAWNPDSHGYGKHSYRHIDPREVNPAEYARNFRGEENHYGDVREYNCAENEKHPENTATLDWLGRIGTLFETESEDWKGKWMVTDLNRVKSPSIFVVAVRYPEEGLGEVVRQEVGDEKLQHSFLKTALDHPDQWTEIPAVALGITVNQDNKFEQVVTKILKQGKISRTMREDALNHVV